MIDEGVLRNELDKTLEVTEFEGLGTLIKGKVRDSYQQGRKRIIVTTDRLSAFDCVLGSIPFKGQVLNQLAAFWFEQTRTIAKNHMLAVPDPNVMVVAECEQLPLEFVVRGYITGVTKTSLWFNYEQGAREFCGNTLPDGLKKNQKLEKPILTPTTKLEKHDRPISREEAIAEGLIDGETFDKAAEICFLLYDYAVDHAKQRGLIFVDTKYEIGRRDGELVLIDEIHTPDSSRYWFQEGYEEAFADGSDQRKLDKEYVREWLVAQGFRGDGAPPELSAEVRVEAAKRYVEAYEIITGQTFSIPGEAAPERILKALREGGYME